jgi:ABC-2 type transport system ATP-binding protein
VDFVIPPKPPLPPRPASSDVQHPVLPDEAIAPDEAPIEPASPEVLDEVPIVTSTDAATEERTPAAEDTQTPEPAEPVGDTVVEVVEERSGSDADPASEAADVLEPVDETPDDTVVLAEAVVVTERADDDEAERLFADVAETAAAADEPALALEVSGLAKSYGSTVAVAGIDLVVPAGTFYGLVGPNGAGKTTTLSMIAGLLKPDAGTIRVAGVDARSRSREAKRLIGVLPDRLRTFDRLTGRQLLSYAGLLRGLDANTVERRASDLGRAFDLTSALGRSVSDYSAGMTKKIMLAAALIHSPRLLVLDEPFEAVDPVSSAVILDILGTYVSHGGTVLLSSHGMDLVERVCDRVAVIVSGQVLADGTVAEVRGEQTLEARFLELAGGPNEVEGLEWLHTFSD